MFTSILVPVDISETEVAQPGLDNAVEIAKANGASLRLVYVRSPIPFAMNGANCLSDGTRQCEQTVQ